MSFVTYNFGFNYIGVIVRYKCQFDFTNTPAETRVVIKMFYKYTSAVPLLTI